MIKQFFNNKISTLADEELVKLVANQKRTAFEVLYKRHKDIVYSLSYQMIGNKIGADEITQESFIQVWNKAQSYNSSKGSVRNWILSIAHNKGIDYIRKLKTQTKYFETSDNEKMIKHIEENKVVSENNVENSVFKQEETENFNEALSNLPDKQADILKLIYYNGYTHHEISEMLNIPLGTVKSRVRLGLNNLKTELEKEKVL